MTTAAGSGPPVSFPGNEELIGQHLGRYRIASSLGRGGMAEVFKAEDDRLSREVAIKVVLPIYASEPQLLQRFLREARVVASLEHPNILPIYDFGDHRGLPFLVLPLIRGGTLADLAGDRAQDPPRIAAWVRDLARALDAAHAAGVLHRDVKPGNVLVGRDEHLFLADFGIARLCDATRLTRTGTVVGTPVYMAPEVAAGKPAEVASDLYSLAVMSYELLAGRPPFDGENVLSILHQHATAPVPPITGDVDLPAGVDQVLERALAKQPSARPPSCRAFAEQLAEQLPGAAVVPPTPVSDLVPTLEVPTLEMAREQAVAPAAAAIQPPTSDAYATLHAPSGAFMKLRQWGLAGLLGGMVAIVGFVALRGLERQPPAAGGVEQAAVEAPAPAADASTPVESPPSASLAASSAAPTPSAPPPSAPPPSVPPPSVPPSSTPDPPPPSASPSPASTPAVPPPSASSTPGPGASSSGGSRPAAPGPEARPGPSRPGAASINDKMRFNALRSFTTRSTEGDFRRAQEASRRLPGHAAGQATAMATYGRGGLAYLDGDDAGATEALRRALDDQRFVAFWGSSPLMLLASDAEREEFEAWELALAYGDARDVAGPTLDELLARQPENARLRFARALVHRLDGEHRAVVRYAQPVFQQLGEGDAPEVRSYLAQVIGDAYLGLDRDEEALEWFRRAFEAGGPLRGIAALRAAEAAREMRRPDLVTEFLERACEADLQPACRRLQSKSRLSRDRR